MKKNSNTVKEKIITDKIEIKKIIGKDTNLTLKDFEKFLTLKYNAKIYNSVQQWYENTFSEQIPDKPQEYVDVLAFPMLEQNYKVCVIKKEKNSKDSVFMLYSYKDNELLEYFIQYSYKGFEPIGFSLFIKNNETKMLKRIEHYYNR